jgi:hypothetical protein
MDMLTDGAQPDLKSATFPRTRRLTQELAGMLVAQAVEHDEQAENAGGLHGLCHPEVLIVPNEQRPLSSPL